MVRVRRRKAYEPMVIMVALARQKVPQELVGDQA